MYFELTSKLAAKLKMCCVMFFQELSQNLENSYFKDFFSMYTKQKLVEYSLSGFL